METRCNALNHYPCGITDILILKRFCPEKFIIAIKKGNVYIDFDARTGHNHGTKFRIRARQIHELYEDCQSI